MQSLTIIFNACFEKGVCPKQWRQNIIHPIPKGASTIQVEPLTYRGLHLMTACGKLYCSILNKRLSEWCELNNRLSDTQNGFRRKRSCLDHLYLLTTIIEDRIRCRKQLYTAFIDAKKAFDRVN